MHNSSYSRPKFVLEAKNIHKSKGKSCGYYLRMVFFFSSLIQTLIIVSLVLFLVYGQPEKTVEEKRVEELENGFNKLSKDNTALRKEKADLTGLLKTRTTEKDTADKKVKKLEDELVSAKSNNSKLLQDLNMCKSQRILSTKTVQPLDISPGVTVKSLINLLEDQKSLNVLLRNNFSQTVQNLKSDKEGVVKEKNKLEMEAMKLKQEKDDLTSELQLSKKTCNEDFVTPLQGIHSVTSAFLTKIEELFPNTFTFHLTCAKQQEEMEKIRGNCTNLSRQVESTFQKYLNTVGEKLTALVAKSSKLEVQNKRLTSDLQQCRQDRAEETKKCAKMLEEAQQNQDRMVQPLLETQNKLIQEKQLLQNSCALKPPVPRHFGLEGAKPAIPGSILQPKVR
ncbi:plasmalemma vesicle associated protein b [Brachyhypopomus gauderio]|uniref:plasmalemma vesicle associated protein b n=1 Tax=Brachyhypopomus gauderio TaxID=698409 RepID=UPI0040430AD4